MRTLEKLISRKTKAHLKEVFELEVEELEFQLTRKDFDGDIRRSDITMKHPYNTYHIKGLPPGPIGLVSKSSLEAAINPKEGTSLYFVAKGDGTHYFSDTLEEHNRAVRKYQLN